MGYGEWRSTITLELVSPLAADATEVSTAAIDRVTGKLFWRSKKPSGQFVVCTGDSTSSATEWTPEGFSVVSRVHEYGGAAFFPHNDELYFVNKSDQRIYKQSSPDATPDPVTEDFDNGKCVGNVRYAEGHVNTFFNKIICVREDHRVGKGEQCINTIVAIDLLTGDQNILAEGDDFYKSADTFKNKIIFVSWMHPNMPWDDTALSIGKLVSKDNVVSAVNVKKVSMGASHLQSRFINKNEYLYLSDKTGYWNVWKSFKSVKWKEAKSADETKPWFESKNEPGHPFGWNFGYPGYDIVDGGIVIGATSNDGTNSNNLLLVDINNPQKVLKDLGQLVKNKGYRFGTFTNILCHGHTVYAIGIDDPANPLTLLRISLVDDSVYIYNESSIGKKFEKYISKAEPVKFQTNTKGMDAYGFLYRPKNPHYTPDGKEKPPLLLRVHGGPTGSASRSLDLKTQYFTSRGFAVFDVDYRGSSGYGRDFRKALYGKWGVYDIDDAISAANHLVKEGIVDENKLAIDGGSAGGYATMAMMVFKKCFHAGVSYYGISDLWKLRENTHKFESHYPINMIGSDKDIYIERSPFYHAKQLQSPIGYFQGSEDRVCPPEQSKMLYKAAKENGVPTFYVEYEGEAHGFKKAENIRRCISNEIYFYSKMFGFELADGIPRDPPPLVNMAHKDFAKECAGIAIRRSGN